MKDKILEALIETGIEPDICHVTLSTEDFDQLKSEVEKASEGFKENHFSMKEVTNSRSTFLVLPGGRKFYVQENLKA